MTTAKRSSSVRSTRSSKSQSPDLPKLTVSDYLEILRKNNGRATPVTAAVIAVMLECSMVKTVNDLQASVSKRLGYTVGYPTIYRVLERLYEIGILYTMHRPDGVMRYYICRDPHQGHHHHFICRHCMRVSEVDMCAFSDVDAHIRDKLGAVVEQHFLQIEGICVACRK